MPPNYKKIVKRRNKDHEPSKNHRKKNADPTREKQNELNLKLDEYKNKNISLQKDINKNFHQEKLLKDRIKQLESRIFNKPTRTFQINPTFSSELKQAYRQLDPEKLKVLSSNHLGIEETLKILGNLMERTVKSFYVDHVKNIESALNEDFLQEKENLKQLESIEMKFQSFLNINKAINDEEKCSVLKILDIKRAKIMKNKEEWLDWVEQLKRKSVDFKQ